MGQIGTFCNLPETRSGQILRILSLPPLDEVVLDSSPNSAVNTDGSSAEPSTPIGEGVGESIPTETHISDSWIEESSEASVADFVVFDLGAVGLDAGGAAQLHTYLSAGKSALGATPSSTMVIAERFFDDSGGMQLIIHAPFGSRINRAWGLALRKRFCGGFGFELEAAATE